MHLSRARSYDHMIAAIMIIIINYLYAPQWGEKHVAVSFFAPPLRRILQDGWQEGPPGTPPLSGRYQNDDNDDDGNDDNDDSDGRHVDKDDGSCLDDGS